MASRGPFMATTLPIALAMVAVTLGVAASGLCPARCRCNDENLRASCAQADLDVVPIQLNPEIHHLDLSNNRIDSLHRAFAFYVDLETLDLSSNLIHTLGANNFDMLENLIALNASNNQIRTIAKSALYGLKRLGELNLSNNNITDIDEQAFRFTSELELLNLSGNSLTSLPDSLLKSLPRIRILLLNNNFLLEVPRTNLALAPSLEHVNLADNLIQELDAESLPSLPSLMSLNLADNVIRYIADGAFDRLPGLLKLNLSGNNLTSVPTPALARLSVLSTLILSRNPLESLNSVAFRNLFELRNLELNDCKIAQVHARAFADNVNLERISMDGNQRLTELPSRVLYGSRYLEWVSLRHCNLASLQPTQFPVDHLSYLRVGGNPLICNCSVHWLWNVIRAEERRNETRLQLDTRDILCADEEFVNKPLIALPEGSLRCRLSPLYLMLSAAGCLTATAMILALIVHVTRAKRKKRLPYTGPPNRPEFLVYVGRPNGELDKHSESYSRRLLTRNEESLVPSYDSPQRVNSKGSPAPPPPAPPPLPPPPLPAIPQETNIYETPRYTRSQDIYSRHPPSDDSGVYAVADVTNFRHEDHHPEVLSAYHHHHHHHHMPTPSAPLQTRRRDYVYDYDYNYDHRHNRDERNHEHEYEREPPVPDKPHVVFV